jgi:UDP-N-acetylmuramoyl-L-alanyl-D-glutamate--2,6-diaminopimelate ligase
METGKDFRVIVDFAHTPNALKQVLRTLKDGLSKGHRLMVVFGAAGLRDREKRPMMGEIAGELADLVVLTAEDPRTEKVEEICEQIAAGCRRAGVEPTIISNRQEAIEFAVKKAKQGDIVVICGKGHEKSMCFGKKEYPWSDQEAVKKALKEV